MNHELVWKGLKAYLQTHIVDLAKEIEEHPEGYRTSFGHWVKGTKAFSIEIEVSENELAEMNHLEKEGVATYEELWESLRTYLQNRAIEATKAINAIEPSEETLERRNTLSLERELAGLLLEEMDYSAERFLNNTVS